MDLVTAERETYESIWSVDAYATHSPGVEFVPIFTDLIEREDGARLRWQGASVLDAGTGSGKGALALQAAGHRVTACDLTDEGLVPEARTIPFHRVALWDDITKTVGYHDYVYCCDVLEHIPPAFTMLVVARLLNVSRHGVFLSISLVPDAFGAWVGKRLHQSVQSFTAWRDQLATVGDLVEARDLLVTGVYFVRPK